MVEEKENTASANAAAGQEPVSKKGAKKQAKAAKVSCAWRRGISLSSYTADNID